MIPEIDVDSRLRWEVELPEVAFRRRGLTFDPRLDLWEWTDGACALRIDFEAISPNFASFVRPLKRTLMAFAAHYSPHYLQNLNSAFFHFSRANETFSPDVNEITPHEIGVYRTSLSHMAQWRVGALNPLLQKWFELRLPGVSSECVSFLKGTRKRGNAKGDAVRTRDPEKGPFDDEEFRAIFRMLEDGRAQGHLPLWSVALTRLLCACGGRISQYASMKIVDFEHVVGKPPSIRVPQVKNGQDHARESFLDFDLTSQMSLLLAEYVAGLRDLGFDDTSALFPRATVFVVDRDDLKRSSGDMFFGHCTASGLSGRLDRLLQPLAPPSRRLGYTLMPMRSRRFRYTFGTRMAEEGASKAVIADRLGHTDLQNVDVYFEASPQIVENIDRAMDAGLAPIADAFRGTVVDGATGSTLKGAPGSKIIDFRVSAETMGACASGCKGCLKRKPVACYTCFSFEPWLDGPHEEYLDALERERDGIEDTRLAQITDDTITAVKQVIEECRLVRAQRHEEAKA